MSEIAKKRIGEALTGTQEAIKEQEYIADKEGALSEAEGFMTDLSEIPSKFIPDVEAVIKSLQEKSKAEGCAGKKDSDGKKFETIKPIDFKELIGAVESAEAYLTSEIKKIGDNEYIG
jgi:hypothetical protein